MRQSGELNRIYWFFLTIFILLIYSAIIVWSDVLIEYKLLAGGIFALIDMGIFACLKESQIAKEEIEDQQAAAILGLPYEQTLPDGNKVHVDALPAPKVETVYYCPKCKEMKRESQTWGRVPNFRLCMKCDEPVIPIENGKILRCDKCDAPNQIGIHNYCWRCQAVLPTIPKERLNQILSVIAEEKTSNPPSTGLSDSGEGKQQ